MQPCRVRSGSSLQSPVAPPTRRAQVTRGHLVEEGTRADRADQEVELTSVESSRSAFWFHHVSDLGHHSTSLNFGIFLYSQGLPAWQLWQAAGYVKREKAGREFWKMSSAYGEGAVTVAPSVCQAVWEPLQSRPHPRQLCLLGRRLLIRQEAGGRWACSRWHHLPGVPGWRRETIPGFHPDFVLKGLAGRGRLSGVPGCHTREQARPDRRPSTSEVGVGGKMETGEKVQEPFPRDSQSGGWEPLRDFPGVSASQRGCRCSKAGAFSCSGLSEEPPSGGLSTGLPDGLQLHLAFFLQRESLSQSTRRKLDVTFVLLSQKCYGNWWV